MKKYSYFFYIKKIIVAILVTILSISNIPKLNVNAISTVYGDVNGDGIVDIADVVAANRFLRGNTPQTSVNMKYLDVDKNTVIDINDSKTINQYILRLISSLPYSESNSSFDYSSYTLPQDSTRSYVKYNCQTGSQSTYTLNQASTASTLAGDIDDREPDSSNNAQAVVYLYSKNGTTTYIRGSGFIVSDHVIATCAHCLYDNNSFNTNYQVRIYDTNGTSVIATYNAKELHIPSQYYNNQSIDYDYGLIYVDEDLSTYGKISLGLPTNNFKLTSQTVNVSGFPILVNDTLNFSRYYGVGNIISATTDYRIYYTTYTSGGNSGGPVYIEYTLNGESFRSAIGIHTASTVNNLYHLGTRITLPVLRFYYSNSNIG